MSSKKSNSALISNNYQMQTLSSFIGTNWKSINYKKTWAAIAICEIGKYLTAVSNNGPIYVSNDYGNTWKIINIICPWKDINMSVNGQYQVACIYDGIVFLSNDYGITWNQQKIPSEKWINIGISEDGSTIIVIAESGLIYKTTNYGVTWKEFTNYKNINIKKIIISSSGKFIGCIIILKEGGIVISKDFGNIFSRVNIETNDKNVQDISFSKSGQIQAIAIYNNYIYISYDYGITWQAKDKKRNWKSITISEKGQFMSATVENGFLYISDDFGNTWKEQSTVKNCFRVRMSANAQYQFAMPQNGFLYLSTIDFGNNNVVTDEDLTLGELLNLEQSNDLYKDANIVTIAGGGSDNLFFQDGKGSKAYFNQITSIAIDNNDNLFVVDTVNNAIRKIDQAGNVTTFAGSGPFSSGSQDGVGTLAKFYSPYGITIDLNNNLYVR